MQNVSSVHVDKFIFLEQNYINVFFQILVATKLFTLCECFQNHLKYERF